MANAQGIFSVLFIAEITLQLILLLFIMAGKPLTGADIILIPIKNSANI